MNLSRPFDIVDPRLATSRARNMPQTHGGTFVAPAADPCADSLAMRRVYNISISHVDGDEGCVECLL